MSDILNPDDLAAPTPLELDPSLDDLRASTSPYLGVLVNSTLMGSSSAVAGEASEPQLSRELPPGTNPADEDSFPSGIVAPDYIPATTYRNWHLQAEYARATLDSGFTWFTDEITYSFSRLEGNIDDSDEINGAPTLFDEKTRDVVRAIFEQVEGLVNLTFVEQTDPEAPADIVFRAADIAEDGVLGYAYLPDPLTQASNVVIDYEALVQNVDPALNMLTPGNVGWHVIQHEIGHALGLKHSFEEPTALPGADDTTNATVMSYSGSTAFSMGGAKATRGFQWEVINGQDVMVPDLRAPQTYQIYDIYALQSMYGANLNSNQGNSTYTMDGSIQIRTLNDRDLAGQTGIDTIRVTTTPANASPGEIVNAIIDLESGGDRVSSYGDTVWWIAYDTWIENAIGGNGFDTITGNDLGNFIDGGKGIDFMAGSYGNDTYVVDHLNDIVQDVGDEIRDPTDGALLLDGAARRLGGVDDVRSSVTFSLNGLLENLTLTGGDDIDGFGNNDTLNGNILIGNTGSNLLDGGLGRDTMSGGLGNDTYVVNQAGESVTENAGEGIDEVRSYVNYVLGPNIENLDLLGGWNASGTGNTLDNRILGNSGNNFIDGLSGKDTMAGGLGNDTYGVDNYGDSITEVANGGIDWVVSSINFNLVLNTENLRLIGIEDLTGRGTAADNMIEGNLGRNLLVGFDGNDTLDGDFQEDTMIGGKGDDIYFVDNLGDVVDEKVGEGHDRVNSTVTYHLGAAIEDLLLLGGASINGFGNAANNYIRGNLGANLLHGRGGDDTLNGRRNADTMVGGGGNDVYFADDKGDVIIERANQGNDILYSKVSQVLQKHVERLYLQGAANINGIGNQLRNRIWGNDGNNLLNGRGGIDTLEGGLGNDTYVVDRDQDVIRERANEGVDLVRSLVTRSLSANLEHLDLLGSESINGTGNSGNNRIRGNAGNNRLVGGGGNDTLLGGEGIDTMVGGKGNDLLELRNAGDVIVELAGGGNDTVNAYLDYVAGQHIENIALFGLQARRATGNQFNNRLTGNFLDNVLTGLGGDDTLDGKAGADTLIGGAGNDLYIIDSFGDKIVEAAGGGRDTVQTNLSYTLAPNLENLILTGDEPVYGYGNGAANLIYGNESSNVLNGKAGNDTLIGRRGADTLIGGTGDDEIWVDNLNDVIREFAGQGKDTVVSTISWKLGVNLENLRLIGDEDIDGSGNTGRNLLIGNSGANFLNGGKGVDTMRGGKGDDTYFVDRAEDTVQEFLLEGTDEVQTTITYAAGANIENITLLGTANLNAYGNSLNNYLVGNAGGNLLLGQAGSDTLDGGLGKDTMRGGSGNDAYYVNMLGEDLQELVGDGQDTVYALTDWTLGEHFEDLVLEGDSPLRGTGNTQNNRITGNSASNYLDGRAGVDTLIGGAGHDTYVVDVTTDSIVELGAGGTDQVMSYANYTLSANVENLTLLGSANLNATGNDLNNLIKGNSGNNTLNGLTGTDTLEGGAGNDTYLILDEYDVVVENYDPVIDRLANNAGYADRGSDTVQTNLLRYQLTSHVENLILIAPADETLRDAQSGYGNEANNVITGTIYNNYLEGGAGSDCLMGGIGEDMLVGASRNGNGRGEIDTLIGGDDVDTFVLGAHTRRYYDDGSTTTPGHGDYALIVDYDPDPTSHDVLVLTGKYSDYVLADSIKGLPAGRGIYYDADNTRTHTAADELIAILQTSSGDPLTEANTLAYAQYV